MKTTMWKQLAFISVAVTIFLLVPFAEARRACGGTYTAARGILSTPNFPGPFDVPIRCQWIIDGSNSVSANSSIVVYLTQLFLLEGLTFTEYQLYGSDYKINPKLIHKVNETNISHLRWVQTYQSYLVIELKLQSSDSAHLRVLDKFLDVYGFNITYEITDNDVRTPSCTMMDCGFTGVCYDHYTKFRCDCFSGFTGPNCSEGPKSFCFAGDVPTCKNGATCLHVGISAIKCHCSKLFTRNTCEVPVEQVTSKDIPPVCAFDGRMENACKCLQKGGGETNPRTGITTTLHFGNLPSLDQTLLKKYIKTQILLHLRAEFPKVENVEVINLIHYMSGADVSLQISAVRNDEKRVRGILNKWLHRGFVGNVTISEKDDSITTLLSLQSLDINQPGEINENSEFILSCVARGSPSITFRWFKDGVFVNLTTARDKWVKLIKDPHVTDQYTALLAVRRPQKYDEGKFTCQVEDFSIQQCRSKFVKIRRRPTVKIEPMTLTVKKGDNFTIKCITLEDDGGNGKKYTYSWTKNKELLPIKTASERYEILYPTGTILQVFRAERDIQYSCLVQDGIIRSEKRAQVYVIDRVEVRTCLKEAYLGQIWPEAAPDTESILECPTNYTGTATRKCLLRDGQKPAWNTPNFSNCMNNFLFQFHYQFERYKIGYIETSPQEVLENYLKYFTRDYQRTLLPSEGAKILSLAQNVIEFMETVKMDNNTLNNITNMVLKIVDKVASSPESVVPPHGIRLLHEVIVTQLKIFSLYMLTMENVQPFNFSFEEIDVTLLPKNNKYLQIPYSNMRNRKQTWTSAKVLLSESRRSEVNAMYSGIIFRSLSRFFPPKSFLRIKDGSEVEYELFSQIISFIDLLSNDLTDDANSFTIVFSHKINTDKLNVSEIENWVIKCGHADSTTFGETWDVSTCDTEVLDELSTRCICPKYGSFVLLLIVSQTEVVAASSNDPQSYMILAGCLLGIALTLLTTLCLGISCVLTNKSCFLILKLQCASSMLLFQVLIVSAVFSELPQHYFMIFLTFLEMFILLAMSSHLSKLLLVLTELIQIPKPNTSKFTVIGIISGVPVITVFGNHLAYRTMNIKLLSWWLLGNTLATNIFVTVLSIISAMFIFIYATSTKKLKDLWTLHEKHRKLIEKRISLVRRAGWLYTTILVYTISSILYVNFNIYIWNAYQFLTATFLMSTSLFVCYIVFPETKIKLRKPDKNDLAQRTNSTDSDLLNFLTIRQPDEDIFRTNLDINEFSIKIIENKKAGNLSKAQSFSNAFESCLQTSTSFCDGSKDDATKQEHLQSPIESYKNSPQSFRKATNSIRSPDILSSKMCVEFDLVASSMHVPKSETESFPVKDKKATEPKTVRITFPPQVIITDDDDFADVSAYEDTEVVERFQPDGQDQDLAVDEENAQNPKVEKNVIGKTSDNLDGVLDSISQDLDYLLNRSDEVTVSPSMSKRNAKNVTISKNCKDQTDNPGILRTKC